MIIVLNECKVVGKGTHKELINTCDVYKEISHATIKRGGIDIMSKQNFQDGSSKRGTMSFFI